MTEYSTVIKCPFCETQCIKAKPGKTNCPSCYAEFEMDDRLECIFVNTEKPRLPALGIICGSCGLIQKYDTISCLYCGAEVNTSLH